MDETTQFKIKATGLEVDAAIPKMPIRAKYPLAPPCPTEEYNTATKNNNTYNNIRESFMKSKLKNEHEPNHFSCKVLRLRKIR